MNDKPGHYRNKSPHVKDKVRVRCLGPGREHHFLSADPTKQRVCPSCRSKQDMMRLGVIELRPVTSYGEE